MKEQWCYWQIKCKEDSQDTFTCTAHLADGRVFQCPYSDLDDRTKMEYPCSDYETYKRSATI